MRERPHTLRTGAAVAAVRTHDEPARWAPTDLVRGLRPRDGVSLVMDGSGAVGGGWTGGPLVALDAEPCWPQGETDPCSPADRLREIDREVAERRRRGGTADTGIAVLAAYEAFGASPARLEGEPGLPGIVALRVDRSVRFHEPARARLTARADDAPAAAALLDATRRRLETLEDPPPRPAAARAHGRPRTSLPRDAYLPAVEAVQRHIAAGDVYQANLCQRFEVDRRGDPFELWADLRRRQPAPRSAFLSWGETVVASQSPETFLSATVDGRIETLPIKGTRPRLSDPVADRRAAEGLLASPKDRAELLMIVDLERNDLGRVCRTGSIRVPELWQLESFATVHHLVARVTGE
nr:hypothetical protein [Actinomycetota bacterium]NIT95619.1 hypothetical protein [Actinomycetota bacterium]NIU19312.1 hypothetical protein [Actinomycetota bacterium]NIV87200.1 hypothetical protein [Actinomycetota bacterium]NIX50604.1 hypothetical protein [Actinomycetota bacterium]